jgi:branched-chain amino acid transport system substrate-binding protein
LFSLSRHIRRLVLLTALLLALCLSACSTGGNTTNDKALTLASIFPTSGAEAGVGTSMQDAVDLAVQQNASLGKGYTLAAVNVDEANGFMDQAVRALAANNQTVGIIGPLDNSDALVMLPSVEANGIATISPSATLPGLTQASAASAEGLDFASLHPSGKPAAFFRLPQTDTALGKVAADVAAASVQNQGLEAQSAFLVDDSTASGKAQAAAFKAEFQADRGSVVGQQSLLAGTQDNTQAIVSAIVEAAPSIVFFAGSITAGAELRSTLTLSGVPLPLLTVGPVADDPSWSKAVGLPAAAALTTALLPAEDLSKLAKTKDFVVAFHTAYPGTSSLPEAALAYDAAMDEISAIRSLIDSGKPVTRAAVLAAVASTPYTGITGSIKFNQNGDNTTPPSFSLYTCNNKGAWQYQATLGAAG